MTRQEAEQKHEAAVFEEQQERSRLEDTSEFASGDDEFDEEEDDLDDEDEDEDDEEEEEE